MIVVLLLAGFIMTLKTRFIQIRQFVHGWKVLFGLYNDPNDKGEISSFQAISAALSATVGIGNIAGVATAIHYGGPGALFWMWVTAILGMSLKFAEIALSIKYRTINKDGEVAGGPMYYIEKGLGPKWKWMAIIFGIATMISALATGNSIQSFTVADQFRSAFNMPTWLTGVITAGIVGVVVIGGIKRIGKVASILAPGMCLLYILGGLLVLIFNLGKIPETFSLIFTSAFTKTAGLGGFAGSGFLFMMMWGIKRGLFSNEAGQGSAPIVYAAVKSNEPVRDGILSMLGPFIDTLMVCSITGLVIVITGVWQEKDFVELPINLQSDIIVVSDNSTIEQNSEIKGPLIKSNSVQISDGIAQNIKFVRNHSFIDDPLITLNGNPYTGELKIDEYGKILSHTNNLNLEGMMMKNGSPLTTWAFKRGLAPIAGRHGGFLITISVFFFAISTTISWSYYGNRGAYYLMGKKAAEYYKWIFVAMVFIGSVVSLETVWAFGDVAIGFMAIPNLVALVLLSNVVRKDVKEYESRKHLTYKQKLERQGK
ncbi:MAG: sodium:alanine symporter family protein [Candidatus Marinimicrobia bacterium]|nr:sodium:alanine symporter family protein [Candidatus Neomarinimicrobiota bacterium]